MIVVSSSKKTHNFENYLINIFIRDEHFIENCKVSFLDRFTILTLEALARIYALPILERKQKMSYL